MLDSLLKLFSRDSNGKEPSSKMESASVPQEQDERPKQEQPRKWMLYSCPFCSGNVLSFLNQTVATGSTWDGEHWALCCDNCGAKGPFGSTKEDCAEKWNSAALMQERNKIAKQFNRLAKRFKRLERERDEMKKELDERKEAEPAKAGMDGLFKSVEWSQTVCSPAPRRIRPSRIGAGRKKIRR